MKFVRLCRQSFDQMIHPKPQRPRMVVKGQRKNNRSHKQNGKHRGIVKVCESDKREINDQNEDFSGNYVRHNCADKEAFLTFEDSATRITVMFEMEWPPHN
jgi:hypothetical protein